MYQRCIRESAGLLIPRRSTAWGGRRPAQPTVRKQRDKWVVRVDGIDTATGKHRPRQLGTYAVAARRPGGSTLRPGRPAQHRTRDGQLARAPLRRRSHRHHAEVAGELRVGDPAHRSRPRRDPGVPPRPRGRRRVDRRVSPPRASSPGGASRSAAPSCAPRSPRPSTKGSSRAARPLGSRSPAPSPSRRRSRRSTRGTPPT